jgi:hypothetical protein
MPSCLFSCARSLLPLPIPLPLALPVFVSSPLFSLRNSNFPILSRSRFHLSSAYSWLDNKMMALVGIIFVLCLAVSVRADLVPNHVYLSLTGNSDAFQVTFTTSSPPSSPFAQIWPTQIGQKGALSIYGDENSTFTFANPNSTVVDYITTLSFSNLTRATFYTYQVCGDAKNQSGTCREFTFRSLPEDDSVLNIGFFGDLGSNATALIEDGAVELGHHCKKVD